MRNVEIFTRGHRARAVTLLVGAFLMVAQIINLSVELANKTLPVGAGVSSILVLVLIAVAGVFTNGFWSEATAYNASSEYLIEQELGHKEKRVMPLIPGDKGIRAWVEYQRNRTEDLVAAAIGFSVILVGVTTLILTQTGTMWVSGWNGILQTVGLAFGLAIGFALRKIYYTYQGDWLPLSMIICGSFSLLGLMIIPLLYLENCAQIIIGLLLGILLGLFMTLVFKTVFWYTEKRTASPKKFGKDLENLPVAWLSETNRPPEVWVEAAKLETLSDGQQLIVKGLSDTNASMTLGEAKTLAKDTYQLS